MVRILYCSQRGNSRERVLLALDRNRQSKRTTSVRDLLQSHAGFGDRSWSTRSYHVSGEDPIRRDENHDHGYYLNSKCQGRLPTAFSGFASKVLISDSAFFPDRHAQIIVRGKNLGVMRCSSSERDRTVWSEAALLDARVEH